MTVGTLIEYLKTQVDKGVTHVFLSEDSRQVIRTAVLEQKASKAGRPGKVAPAVPASQVSQLSPPREQVPPPAQRPTRSVAKFETPVAPAQPIVTPESVPLELPAGELKSQIAYLRQQAQTWAPAHTLGTLRDKLVFSVGNPDTKVVFVGDSPGFDEELKGEPFVGRSGQKLDLILKAMGMSRQSLYITNICKYRPSLPGQTMNNRKPNAQELAACMPLLKKEIEAIKPQCIVALGAAAADGLLGQQNSPVGRLRGSWHEFEGTPVRVTYHPNYLLRNEDNIVEKRKLWEDMLTVMEHLEMPISERQKGFFTK